MTECDFCGFDFAVTVPVTEEEIDDKDRSIIHRLDICCKCLGRKIVE